MDIKLSVLFLAMCIGLTGCGGGGEDNNKPASDPVTENPDPITSSVTDNLAPIAMDDSANTAFNTGILINVLANDTDPDGDPLHISQVSAISGGQPSIEEDQIRFTPTENFSGQAQFDYQVSDAHGLTSSAKVSVQVIAPVIENLAPMAMDDSASTAFNTGILINVLANDSDPDGDPLHISQVSAISGGQPSIEEDQIRFTPTENFSGQAQFDYQVSDAHGLMSSAKVSVQVLVPVMENSQPIANADTVLLNRPWTGVIDPLVNDTDPDGDPLNIINARLVSDLSEITLDIADNKIHFFGADRLGVGSTAHVEYTISDGHTAPVIGTILVTLNNPPSAQMDSVQIWQGESVTLDVLANDFDIDEDQLKIVSVTPRIDEPDGLGSMEIITQDAYQQLKFTPLSDFVGFALFDYVLEDEHGDAALFSGAVSIEVLSEQVPILEDDSASTAYETPVTIAVLDNDSDNEAWQLLEVVQAPNEGTAEVLDDLSIHYTPAEGFSGEVSFHYQVTDPRGNAASAEVVVTVAEPEPLQAVADIISMRNDHPRLILPLENDLGYGILSLSSVAVEQVVNGLLTVDLESGELSYRPNSDFVGNERFSYQVTNYEGEISSAQVVINVREQADLLRAIDLNDIANNDLSTAQNHHLTSDHDTELVKLGERLHNIGDINDDGVNDLALSLRSTSIDNIAYYLLWGIGEQDNGEVSLTQLESVEGDLTLGQKLITSSPERLWGLTLPWEILQADLNLDGQAELWFSDSRPAQLNGVPVSGLILEPQIDLMQVAQQIIKPGTSVPAGELNIDTVFTAMTVLDLNQDGNEDLLLNTTDGIFVDGVSQPQVLAPHVQLLFGPLYDSEIIAGVEGTVAVQDKMLIEGITRSGWSATGVPSIDMDQDGFTDLVISATNNSHVKVIWSRDQVFPPMLNLLGVSPEQGITLQLDNDNSIKEVKAVADVNGDGSADMLLYANTSLYLIYSQSQASWAEFISESGVIEVATLVDRQQAQRIELRSTYATPATGDVNQDGYADVLLYLPQLTQDGELQAQWQLLLGSAAGFPSSIALSDVNSHDCIIIADSRPVSADTRYTSLLQDFNADGFDDIVISNGLQEVFVIYGGPQFGVNNGLAISWRVEL
ncbi:Ig-like domain-containing protein [uncultured Shewanella sp.]|uniref:Ig-like domain-containing protein n=1 Tax=uncultured Shewanella sp. TaxID=173975 RepID=UPI00262A4429|nr:Ig-like domain-containing protein [uncultured Shewanella sp.]